MRDFQVTVVSKKFMREEDERPEKKKKKKKYNSMYPDKMMEDYCNCFKGYKEIVGDFGILTNLAPRQYADAMKTLRKLIKELERGNGEAVFDQERYEEYCRWKDHDDD